MSRTAKLTKVVLGVTVIGILLLASGSAAGKADVQTQALPKEKEMIIAVDYSDNVVGANRKGELGDTPLIKQIMDDIKSAGGTAVCWRVSRSGSVSFPSKVYIPYFPRTKGMVTSWDLLFKHCDPLRVAVDYAHEIGLKIYPYITLFDDAYENRESEFGHEHPEYYIRHYRWKKNLSKPSSYYIKGIFSYGYPEVRTWRMKLVKELISYGADGIYIDCARTHAGIHAIPVHGWYPTATMPHTYYGYNDYEVARYRKLYGKEPPRRSSRSLAPREPSADEINWNKVRGSFLTEFMREASGAIRAADQKVFVAFFPKTYNGFNPGYQTRQQLGWFDIAWEQWVEEGLIDEIRLIVDHRKFGFDDWVANSQHTYKKAQDAGVKVYIDCAIESEYDKMENPPCKLPITKKDNPDVFFSLMENMTFKMLNTTADGVLFYDHPGNDERTWKALRNARKRYKTSK